MNENEKEKYLEQIANINKMMESNSKFLSLSGLSGVWAGSIALLGAWIASIILKDNFVLYNTWQSLKSLDSLDSSVIKMLCIGGGIFVVAIVGGIMFTHIKARKLNERMFNKVSFQMLYELFFVLMIGGIFCLIQLYHGVFIFLAATTLIFYGLALFIISRFTVRDIKILAYLEIILGLLNAIFIYNGLLFWCIGFGVLHIIYGIMMYYKYDKN